MVLVPLLYTKERNVSSGLGRNLEPLAILLPLFSLCKAEIAAQSVICLQKAQLEHFDFHIIAWNKPNKR